MAAQLVLQCQLWMMYCCDSAIGFVAMHSNWLNLLSPLNFIAWKIHQMKTAIYKVQKKPRWKCSCIQIHGGNKMLKCMISLLLCHRLQFIQYLLFSSLSLCSSNMLKDYFILLEGWVCIVYSVCCYLYMTIIHRWQYWLRNKLMIGILIMVENTNTKFWILQHYPA